MAWPLKQNTLSGVFLRLQKKSYGADDVLGCDHSLEYVNIHVYVTSQNSIQVKIF